MGIIFSTWLSVVGTPLMPASRMGSRRWVMALTSITGLSDARV